MLKFRQNNIRLLGVILFIFSLLSLSGAELWQEIPAGADVAFYFRSELLLQHPVIRQLERSGEMKKLREILDLLPLNRDKSQMPDVMLLFFGQERSGGILGITEYAPGEFAAKLAEQLKSKKNYTIRQGVQNNFKVIQIIRKRSKGDRISHVVFLADNVVFYVDSNKPLPWKSLIDGGKNQNLIRLMGNLAENALISGVALSPQNIGMDPFGVTRKMEFFSCSLKEETNRALQADLTAEFADETSAMQSANNVQMFVQIVLLALFRSEPELLTQMNRQLQFHQQGKSITASAGITAQTVEEFRKAYERNPGVLKNSAGIQ